MYGMLRIVIFFGLSGSLVDYAAAEQMLQACLAAKLSTNLTEWQSNKQLLKPVNVTWNADMVCNSISSCYGVDKSDDSNAYPQLPPVHVQPGVDVIIKASSTSNNVYFMVNQIDFVNCNYNNGYLLNTTTLSQTDGTLPIGMSYYIGNSSTDPWNTCSYGLRLSINVQVNNCSNGGSSMCSGHGRCVADSWQLSYTCQCCSGYVGAYCENVDGCLSVTCANGGTCVNTADDVNGNPFKCNCNMGYEGALCQNQTIYFCKQRQCSNGGTCVDDNSLQQFHCICTASYTGKVCENRILACSSSNPCLNGGSCIDRSDGYNCSCSGGFIGVNCENKICPDGFCSNGGTCIAGSNNAPSCNCVLGFGGTHCEILQNHCLPNPCKNSIECVDHPTYYNCTCKPGYTGVICDINIDECLSNPCHNGTCQDQVAGYVCVCPGGTDQPYCTNVPVTINNNAETRVPVDNGHRTLSIIAGVLSALVIIALLFLVIYCCRLHGTYKRFVRPRHYVKHIDDKDDVVMPSRIPTVYPGELFDDNSFPEDNVSFRSAKAPLVRRTSHKTTVI